MSAVANSPLKIIDFFLSPENHVSAQARMRARIVVFIFLFWAFLDAVGLTAALFAGLSDSWMPGLFLIVNLTCALSIKRSFSPEKVYLANSGLFVIFQLLSVIFQDYLEPLSFITFTIFIYTNCLIAIDLKVRLALVAFILTASYFAFALLYNANMRHLWSLPTDPTGNLILLGLSTIFHLAIFPMAWKIKAIAQSDLDLEIFWQERAQRLEDSSLTTKAMGELLAGPIQAVQKELEKLKKNPDPFAMDDLQKQLDELLAISNAVSWIYRTQRGEESLPLPSLHQELLGELLIKIKGSR